MSDMIYPQIDENALSLIARASKGNPMYFLDEKCPYSQRTKEIFNVLQETKPDGTINDGKEMSRIEQIRALMQELNDYGKADGRSSADKNTYFRLSVTLMKELLDLEKEASLLADHELFVNEILSILDEICDADQRATVQTRLKKFMGESNNEVDTE